jgi:hypothetical protein
LPIKKSVRDAESLIVDKPAEVHLSIPT